MIYKLKKTYEKIRIRLNKPFYENSFFIMLTSISSSFVGFIFWIMAAKVYNADYVGISTALISALTLISYISLLGFDQSIIRFFPEREKSNVLSTSIIISSLSATLFCFIFIAGINIWSPSLSIIKENALIFYIFLITNILTVLAGNAFIALRKAKYYFLQNIMMGSRLILLFPFIMFSTLGIFFSYGFSFILALILSIFLLLRFGIKPKKLDKEFINDSLHFSTGTYIFSLLLLIPGQILSIIILNTLGANYTAYYYISITLYSILIIVPSAFGTSLFVEGSHGESLKQNVLKSLKAIYIILIPLIIVFYILGGFLLGLIGPQYLEATEIFRFMVLSTFFAVFLHIFISIKKVQKDIKSLILIGLCYCSLLIGTSYVLMLKIGLSGIGYAWLISYIVISIIIIILAKKENWI